MSVLNSHSRLARFTVALLLPVLVVSIGCGNWSTAPVPEPSSEGWDDLINHYVKLYTADGVIHMKVRQVDSPLVKGTLFDPEYSMPDDTGTPVSVDMRTVTSVERYDRHIWRTLLVIALPIAAVLIGISSVEIW